MAPTIKNYRRKSELRYSKNTIIPSLRGQPCLARLQLTILIKLPRTYAVPNMAPFIQRLLCFMRTIMDYGASVKALASGTYASLYLSIFLM